MIRIGPYHFTAQDVERTLRHVDELWELYRVGRDASTIDDRRPHVTGDAAVDLPAVWEAFTAAGPALRAAGQLPPRTVGRVAHLHTSAGGVPKRPVDSVDVDHSGVVGDVQKSKQHHGAPWQALCIWSTESIEQLVADGHQVFPGAAGENITVTGLPWAEVRAGVRLQLGEVLCEASAFALPCHQNKRWFAGGDFRAMHHERGPSRMYATVLTPGRISVGDDAILEP